LSNAEALWRRIYESFHFHRFSVKPPDPDSQTALNRIAAKCIGVPGRSFDPSTCSVRAQVLSVEQLRQLRLHHTRSRPQRDEQPIVVLSFEGQLYVVDGNTRVNRWLADGSSQPRAAIIIEPGQA
jgi:hypothetical protein